jgi:hypothetical protein
MKFGLMAIYLALAATIISAIFISARLERTK